MPAYHYRAEVLALLSRHGVSPATATPPSLVHEFVSALYRFELRRLRDRLRRNEIPRIGYADRVVALRRRYPLASLAPDRWVE